MRWVWATIVGLSVLAPAALIAYGHHVNVHTTSTVGGPLTEGLSVALAIAFDLLLWLCFAIFLAGRSARRAARDLQNSPPSAVWFRVHAGLAQPSVRDVRRSIRWRGRA
jgi:hypothetical protein